MKKKILIVGILGQDGRFLTEILSKDEYEIVGICKVGTEQNRIENFKKEHNVKIIESDFVNFSNVVKVLQSENPKYIVNLGGISNVFNPWENLQFIYEQNSLLPINLLRYISEVNKDIFFFQASSSLMYGGLNNTLVDENTCSAPIYPYGINKLYVHNFINEYRKKYNIKVCSGIFFNHESTKYFMNLIVS